MEAKADFGSGLNKAVGQIVNYGAHLAHNCYERKVVKGVLFDKHKFYFAYINDGTLTRLIECKWTDAGSETFLRKSLHSPGTPPGSWMKLLDAVCQYAVKLVLKKMSTV
jgi:hypothetical protein